MLITPKAIVFTAPGFRVARLFMLGTDAQEGGGAKIRHPPFRLGYLQETHKWALVSFLRIGTLGRHLAAWAAQEACVWRLFLANFHTVPLAAIGHMDDLDAGHALKQFTGQVRRGAGPRGGISQFAWIGPGVVDEAADRSQR
jgi:hypothetical protein